MSDLNENEIVAALQRTTVASVSDAIDDVIGQRGFMRNRHAAVVQNQNRWSRRDSAT